MNNKERARDLHYKLIEDFGLAGNHNVARDLIISVLNEARSAAIDEAVKVLDGYITITEAEEEDGLHWSRNITSQISDKIKELKND